MAIAIKSIPTLVDKDAQSFVKKADASVVSRSNDSHNYSLQLSGKSYCFLLESDRRIIVCAFTVANDSIKANFLPNGSK